MTTSTTDGRAPNPRLAALLEGPSRWTTLVHLPETASTNEELSSRLDQLAPGVVCLADVQTAGRGRSGRAWLGHPTRPEGSLLVSMLIDAPKALPLTPLAAGLATADALVKAGVEAQLKWPNDVLVDGRKIAGLLAEHHPAVPGRPARVILGIGVDVDWRDVDRSGEQADWISAAEAIDADVDRFEVLTDLLAALQTWLADLDREHQHVRDLYAARCTTLGQVVEATAPDGSVLAGTAVDIDPTGALVLDTASGRHAIRAADVRHAG